eukprot:1149959-Pelagomonas_calceolata.AAC.2
MRLRKRGGREGLLKNEEWQKELDKGIGNGGMSKGKKATRRALGMEAAVLVLHVWIRMKLQYVRCMQGLKRDSWSGIGI